MASMFSNMRPREAVKEAHNQLFVDRNITADATCCSHTRQQSNSII